MQSITGRVFNVESKYITNPESNEFITIWRNKLDNKYYGRRSDGVDEPLGGGGSIDCFDKLTDIQFLLTDEPSTFNECYLVLEPGNYIFDVDYNCAKGDEIPIGGCNGIICTNLNPLLINNDNSDVVHREIGFNPSYFNENGSSSTAHLMTGKLSFNQQFVFKAKFVDASGSGNINVGSIFIRAIKIG